jgi:glycosyltransferase involved in cell wall biosynthesis
MKIRRIYFCPDHSNSGVSHYAQNFYKCVAQKFGFESLSFPEISELTDPFWIHLEMGHSPPAEFLPALAKLTQNPRVHTSITIHDPPYTGFEGLAGKFLRNMAPSLADELIRVVDRKIYSKASFLTLSQKAKKKMSKLRVENVSVIPHVVNDDDFCDPDSKRDLNSFVFFGYISPLKGIEYAIDIFSRIHSLHPEACFHIIGEGDEKYLEKLKEKVSRSAIDNVHFYGYLDEPSALRILDSCSFALLPTEEFHWVPVSGSLLTVIKRGVIPFTTDVNAHSEVVSSGQTAFFLEKNIQKDVSLILSKMHHDSETCNQMRKKIISHLRENFSAEVVASQFGAFIEQQQSFCKNLEYQR